MPLQQQKPVTRIFIQMVKVTIVLGLFVYLWRLNLLDFRKVWEFFQNLPLIALLFIWLGFHFLLIAWRFVILVKPLCPKMSFPESTQLTFIGHFFNICLPGTITGDFVKIYYLLKKQNQLRKPEAAALVLWDRIFGLAGLVFVAGLVVIWRWEAMRELGEAQRLIPWIIGLNLLLITGGAIFTRVPIRPLKWLRIPMSAKTVAQVLLLSMANQLLLLGFFAIVAHQIDGLNFSAVAIIMPLGFIISLIPIAPAGIGVGHAAFAWLFQFFGSNHGADIFTVFIAFHLAWGLIGGLVYLFFKPYSKLPPEIPDP